MGLYQLAIKKIPSHSYRSKEYWW